MTKLIKIICVNCHGAGYEQCEAYPNREPVKIVCPVCVGYGFLEYEQWEKKKE